MPIGKDSITKRVAKVDTTVAKAEKPAVAPKTTAKKPASKTTATTKKPATKKPATTVIANIAPETVEAVVGHKENGKFDKVELGGNLPYYLL